MIRFVSVVILAAALGAASIPQVSQARELYQRTEYQSSLNLLLPLANKDSDALELIGRDYFMLGDYKKAADAFDHALSLDKSNAQLYLWAGRAYGRRAETSGPFSAPGLASRARKDFEIAAQMNILDKEATGDLFDYYLGAPGFLGGGLNKAQDLAQKVLAADPAEGQHMLAVLAEKSKDFAGAEQHLRQAITLAPKQASRVMELARFLAKRGRLKESDGLFDEAMRMAPQDHAILFYRAESDVDGRHNLNEARSLLQAYLSAPLTPNDPPRERARDLLAKASSH